MIAGGLSFVGTGCILGSDPNHNSMIFGAPGGSSGTGGTTGGAGTTGRRHDRPDGPEPVQRRRLDTSASGFVLNTYMEQAGSINKDLGDGVHCRLRQRVMFDDSLGQPETGLARGNGAGLGANATRSRSNTGMSGTSNPVNWKGGNAPHGRIKCDEGTFGGVAELTPSPRAVQVRWYLDHLQQEFQLGRSSR